MTTNRSSTSKFHRPVVVTRVLTAATATATGLISGTLPTQAAPIAEDQPTPHAAPQSVTAPREAPTSAAVAGARHPASRTSADTPVVRLHNVATGRCLDSYGRERIYVTGCNDGDFQKWWEIDQGEKHYNYKNKAVGLCLESTNRDIAPPRSCNNSPGQQWKFFHGQSGSSVFVYGWGNGGLCLTDSGEANGRVYAAECQENNWRQRWYRHVF